MLEALFNQNTIITAISLATPILLASLGGCICSKSGNFNMALEGFMLMGAFTGIAGSYFFKNVLIGLLFAILGSTIMALLYGLFVITFKANEVISGFGLNMLALALTGWLLGPVFGGLGSFYDPTTPFLHSIRIPFLDKVPILSAISGHNIIVYLSWILAFASYFMVYHTPYGYKLRALGENPESLKSIGCNPDLYAYSAQILTGVLCGLAGASLSIGSLAMFTENMTAGRGLISVTAVIFSKAYLPVAAIASMLFGLANSIAIQLQGLGLPSQIVEMVPYLITVFMLIPDTFKKVKVK